MPKFPPILIVLLLGLLSALPLFHKGLIPTHDGEYNVIRAFEFDKTLRSGSFYPRWQQDLNFGYGSPLSNYYYPLPYYSSSLFHAFGLSFIDSFKAGLIGATFIGGLLFYLWIKSFWGIVPAVVGSIFYLYSPYRFVDVYIRGSIGEIFALSLFPGFLWAITKTIKEKEKKYIVISSIFFALTILSHNILGYMFALFGIVYTFFLLKLEKKKYYIGCMTAFLLGLGMSAVFWMPALLEKPYVKGLEIFDYSKHFPELYQLIFPSWGTGFSGIISGNEMSYQLGIANLVIIVLCFVLLLKIKNKYDRKIITFFLTLFFIIVYLMHSSSLFFWKNIPLFNYFQFPWRFLSLEILIAPFLAGSVMFYLIKKWKNLKFVYIVIFSMLAIALSISYIKPAYYLNRDDSYYFSKANFMDGTNTPGNVFNTIWFKQNLLREREKITRINGDAIILSQNINPIRYFFSIRSGSASSFQVNTAYFPGWEVKIDGKKQFIAPDKNGLFSFVLIPGTHSVRVELKNTLLQTFASWITILSTMSAFILLKTSVFAKIKK